MRRLLSILALSAAALPAWAAPPKVPAPLKAAVGEDVQVEVQYDPKAGLAYFPGFDVKHCLLFRGYEEPGSGRATFLLRPKVNGEFRVGFVTVGEREFAPLVLTAGGGPTPGPDPPKPDPPKPDPPKPDVAPIPLPGLRVLMVYETAESLTPGQHAAMYAKEVRDYLTAKTAKGLNGQPEWRQWDQHLNVSGAEPHWRDAMKRTAEKVAAWKRQVGPDGKPVGPTQALPWILISHPEKGGGFEGPLPGSVQEMMDLLRKWGG